MELSFQLPTQHCAMTRSHSWMHSLNRRVFQVFFAVHFLFSKCSFGLSFITAFSFHQDSVWRWIWSGNFRLADWKSKLLHEIKPPPEKIHLLCKKLYAGLCSGGGQILTSMITWINTQVDGVPLPLAPLLLVHLQHPPHRQQHAWVSGRPWGGNEDVNCLYIWCLFLTCCWS